MTNEEINIAIAEVCGWKQVTKYNLPEEIWENLNEKPSAKAKSNLPNYCNDLNAMHEAEKTLPDLNLYRRFLYLVVLEDPTNKGNEPAFATARQRAEAFLRTLGIWRI